MTLPSEITGQFQDVFIPMLLAYYSIVPNSWKLPCPLQEIIVKLWPVVFPHIVYDEQLYGSGTPVFMVVSVLCYLSICSRLLINT